MPKRLTRTRSVKLDTDTVAPATRRPRRVLKARPRDGYDNRLHGRDDESDSIAITVPMVSRSRGPHARDDYPGHDFPLVEDELELEDGRPETRKEDSVTTGCMASEAACDSITFLRLVFMPGDVIQVTAISPEGKVKSAGFYEHGALKKLVEDAERASAGGLNVFFGFNPVRPGLLKAAKNKLSSNCRRRAKAMDVIRRRWIMIDVDVPNRGDRISTAKELEATQDLMADVGRFLESEGWPYPIITCSGNGFHLLYRIDLPTDDGGLVKQVLQTLALRFNSNKAEIDVGRSAANQLDRLPDTINWRGHVAPGRPRRRCTVEKTPPDGIQIVTRQKLEELTGERPATTWAGGQLMPAATPADLEHVRAYVQKLPPAVSGQRGHDRTFATAAVLVIDFGLSVDQAWPIMREYNQRCQPPWDDANLRRKLQEAEKHALLTGEPRGLKWLAVPGVKQQYRTWPPLVGPEFLGHLPDFITYDGEILQTPLDNFGSLIARSWFYSWWVLLRANPRVPDAFLRQLMWGATYPPSWRRTLRRQVDQLQFFSWLGGRSRCRSSSCIHGQLNLSHGHFVFHETMRYPLLEAFAKSNKKHRRYDLFSTEFKKARSDAWRKGLFAIAYVPALLLSAAKPVGWTLSQQRLLIGVARELTLAHKRRTRGDLTPEMVTDALVPSNKSDQSFVKCPNLQEWQQYVTFGGNGRRHGQGYTLLGRNGRGWLYKAGYRPKPGYSVSTNADDVTQFLHDLRRLAADLDLVVVGYNNQQRTARWRNLEEMIDALRPGHGRGWLDECCLRIYAPADWLVRWRYFFSKKLGFRWIPSSRDDLGPGGEALQQFGPDDVRRTLKQRGWTHQELANQIERMTGQPCSRQRVERHLNGSSRTELFFDQVREVAESAGLTISQDAQRQV